MNMIDLNKAGKIVVNGTIIEYISGVPPVKILELEQMIIDAKLHLEKVKAGIENMEKILLRN